MVRRALDRVQPEDFYGLEHTSIWREVLRMHRAGERPCIGLARKRLGERALATAVACAKSTSTPANTGAFATIVCELAQMRRLLGHAESIGVAVRNGTDPHEIARLADVLAQEARTSNGSPSSSLDTFDLAALRDATDQQATWAVHSLLAFRMLTILHGAPKDGKTLLALALAAALARGDREWAGFALIGEPVPVLFLTESAPSAILEKADRVLDLPPEGIHYAPATVGNTRLRSLDDVLAAAGEVAERAGTRVTVVDTTAHWARLGVGEENDNALMGSVIRNMRSRLAIEGNRAVLALAHSGKAAGADPIAGLRGAGAAAAEADAVIRLSRVGGEGSRRRRLRGRGRLEAHALDVTLELDTELRAYSRRSVTPGEQNAECDRRLLTAIAELSEERPDAPGFGVDPIRERAGFKTERARACLRRMAGEGGPLVHDQTLGYRRRP